MKLVFKNRRYKMRTYLSIILSILFFFPVSGFAEGLYAGLKYGAVSSEYADLGTLEISLGRSISEFVTFEGQYSTTIKDDDIGGGVKLSTDYLGVFAAFKSKGDTYGKARVGVVKIDFEMEFQGAKISDDEAGLSYGVGVGFVAGNGAIEIEYTKLPDPVTYCRDSCGEQEKRSNTAS